VQNRTVPNSCAWNGPGSAAHHYAQVRDVPHCAPGHEIAFDRDMLQWCAGRSVSLPRGVYDTSCVGPLALLERGLTGKDTRR
jgi:hypothetical protein